MKRRVISQIRIMYLIVIRRTTSSSPSLPTLASSARSSMASHLARQWRRASGLCSLPLTSWAAGSCFVWFALFEQLATPSVFSDAGNPASQSTGNREDDITPMSRTSVGWLPIEYRSSK